MNGRKQRYLNHVCALVMILVLSACALPATPAPAANPEPPTATAVISQATAAATVAAAELTPAEPVLVDTPLTPDQFTVQEFTLPAYPHDVAPDPADPATVWWTAQGAGALGRLNPTTGESTLIPLGAGSSPHGVIIGPDGAAWVTDGGLNAIARVDPATEAVTVFPLPDDRPNANLNTCAFDGNGILWFTGQNGIYGRLDPATGDMQVYDAPRGRGPYGIDATPAGEIYYASLAGSHIAKIDITTGEATPIDSPTANQGARRVWSDSQGNIWVSEWNAGQVGVYKPASGEWQEWKLPGDNPMAYAVYVDEADRVWLSDFGANMMVLFDPTTEAFHSFPLSPSGNVRQILGRPGEVWGAESGADKLILIRTAAP